MSSKLLKKILSIVIRFVNNRKKLIGLICFFIVWWKRIRPKDHDNIPTLPEADPLSGHIILRLRKYETLLQSLHNMWKRQALPIFSLKTWFQYYVILLCEPNLIKYVFETQFEKFKKGPGVQSIFNELLGHGIFVSDPPQWRLHQQFASRMFSMRSLKYYMFACGVFHSKLVINKLDTLDRVDIHDIFSRFTLDAFSNIAFGKSVNSLNDNACAFRDAFDEIIYQMSFRMVVPWWFWKITKYFNIGNEKSTTKNIQIIDDFYETVLKQRQKEIYGLSDEFGNKNNDILSLFMAHNKELNRNELRDIALNIIIAGRDTTRLLCSWFIYEMTLHSHIKDKIYQEIDELIGPHTTYDIKHDDVVNKLHYLEACLLETLRLHPAVPWLIRYAQQDVKLPAVIVNGEEKKYIIRKGNQVVIPTYIYGRSSHLWKDAETFDPMRFYDGNEFKGMTKHSTYVYPFFNIQPRLCLGRKLALTVAKTILFYFFQEFDFNLEPNQEIHTQSGPINGLWIELEKR